MKEIKYQQKYVRKLVDETIDLLRLSGHRKTLIFKAPTGSGKTVMASQLLADLTEELQSRGDSPYNQVAFIWIAPNKLHQQSYFKMKNYFTETRLLRPVMYDELDQSEGIIKAGEILFVNWESINKEKNVMVRDSEQNASLYEITRRTQEEQGLPIVVVIDEEHLFWSKSADKSAKVLQKINPKVEIRISATPKTRSDHQVTIDRQEVVSEEMIKKQVVLNPDITQDYHDENELNIHLIQCALQKRNLLAEAYKNERQRVGDGTLGTNINPLLLIQLPNDTSESMTSEDAAIADQVKTYLREVKGITTENKKLAVWLSGEKANLDGLEEPDNMTEVLLFKQAIALGWDCPRAAVLLIFRKLQSNQFTIQTVGRILRMPEQKFYKNDLLNVGYVYTDISRDQIQIVAEDMDYLNKDALQAVRREHLHNVALQSYYSIYKSSDRNRLGPDFKKELIDCFSRNWLVQWRQLMFSFSLEDENGAEEEPAENMAAQNQRQVREKEHIKFDVTRLGVEVPENIVFQNEVGIIDVEKNKREFARSAGEVRRIYIDYCRSLLGGFEKAHSTDVLAGYLLQAMEELFELFETDAMKVILYHANKPKFTDIIQKALASYERKLQERQRKARDRAFEQYTWEVPAERLYKETTHHAVAKVEEHALLPFIELNAVSTPERRFSDYLEANKAYVDWWYKNGDEGKQHYSVPYENSQGEKALFYVDFVARMKNGQVLLFDTKTENSDPEAPYKHNALIDYMEGKGLQGGIIVEKNAVWLFSRFHIDTTENVTGWEPFFPDQYV